MKSLSFLFTRLIYQIGFYTKTKCYILCEVCSLEGEMVFDFLREKKKRECKFDYKISNVIYSK